MRPFLIFATNSPVRRAIALALAFGLVAPASAQQTEDANEKAQASSEARDNALPDPVRALIEAAIATGDKAKVATVIELAKQTNPDAATEIDALQQGFLAEQQRLAEERQRKEQLTQESEETERQAQQDAEAPQDGLFDNWEGEGELGAFRSTGNADELGVTASLKLVRDALESTHELRGRVEYRETNGNTSREQYFLGYETRYDVAEDTFLYGLATYEQARFQGYRARYSLSGGVGYRLWDTDSVTLRVQGGPAYRYVKLQDDETESVLAALALVDFDWQLADTITFTQDARAYLNTGNSTFQATTGLEAKVLDNVSVRFAYTVEHQTDPPPAAVKTDTLSRVTIIYGF